jgi:hypothetical protein
MMGANKLTAQARAEIIAAHQRGETLASIAARFDVSKPYVSMLAKSRGQPPRGMDARWKRRAGLIPTVPSAKAAP